MIKLSLCKKMKLYSHSEYQALEIRRFFLSDELYIKIKPNFSFKSNEQLYLFI